MPPLYAQSPWWPGAPLPFKPSRGRAAGGIFWVEGYSSVSNASTFVLCLGQPDKHAIFILSGDAEDLVAVVRMRAPRERPEANPGGQWSLAVPMPTQPPHGRRGRPRLRRNLQGYAFKKEKTYEKF